MFIRSGSPHAAGSLLKFELLAGESVPPIVGVGRVVWSRALAAADAAHPAGMGVKFLRLEGEGAQWLTEIRRRAERAQQSSSEGERLMAGSRSGDNKPGEASQEEAGSADSDRASAYDMAKIPSAPRSPALESMLRGVAREPYGDAKPVRPELSSSGPPKGVFSQPPDLKRVTEALSASRQTEGSVVAELSLSDPAVSAEMMAQTFGMATGFEPKKKLPALPKVVERRASREDDTQTVRLTSKPAESKPTEVSRTALNETAEFFRDSDEDGNETVERVLPEVLSLRSGGTAQGASALSAAAQLESAGNKRRPDADRTQTTGADAQSGASPEAGTSTTQVGEDASQAVDLAALASAAAASRQHSNTSQVIKAAAEGPQDKADQVNTAVDRTSSSPTSVADSTLDRLPRSRSRWWLPALVTLALGAAVAWVIFEPGSTDAPAAEREAEPRQEGHAEGAAVAASAVAAEEPAGAEGSRMPDSPSATPPSAAPEVQKTPAYRPELLESEGPSVPVVVNSRPAGATLTVEGKPFGKTPRRLTLPEGVALTVEATKPGYAEARRSLVAARGESLTIALEPIVYRVRLTSNPTGAEFLLGSRVIKAPDTLEVPRVTGPLVIYARLPHHHKLRFVVNPDDFAVDDATASYHLHAELVARDYDKIAEEAGSKRASDTEAPASASSSSSSAAPRGERPDSGKANDTAPSAPAAKEPDAEATPPARSDAEPSSAAAAAPAVPKADGARQADTPSAAAPAEAPETD